MLCCGLHKTTQTIGYAPLFECLYCYLLEVTAFFKYFEWKLSNDGYGREFECKDIIQFALNMRKLSLVNETLRLETETRLRRLTFCPRRDRDIEKMRLETVSKQRRRDRDYVPALFTHSYNKITNEITYAY